MSGNVRRGTRLGSGSIRFSYDGREYSGQPGDTAASALLAQGVRYFGRSVKYRRLRGVLAAGPEEPNALLTVGERPAVIPNVSAPQLAIRDGLTLRSQNRWPTLARDLASLLQAGGGFFGAGFYYKTFIWPTWRTYEPIIRRLAGLGEAPGACELPPIAVEYLSCDVLVAGAGAAGLAAARAAARAGARVVLCEREPACGGELEFEGGRIEGQDALPWVAVTLAELAARGVRLLTDTAVVGGSGGQLVLHAEPGGLPGASTLYRVRPRSFVIAMGAVERPIAFIDNDRPGVMLLGAAERYLARYGVSVGRELVLFANHDRVYAAAARLAAGGMRVRAIVDTRSDAGGAGGGAASLRDELERQGTVCLAGHAVIAAEGGREVRAVRVAPLSGAGPVRRIACDTLLHSGGWSPCVQAGLQEGGAREYSPGLGAFLAAAQPQWRILCGAANGQLELGAVLADGRAAGEQAARHAGHSTDAAAAVPGCDEARGEIRGDGAPRLVAFWRSPAPPKAEKRQFVDLQNDVTVADLRAALAEGFVDIEHVKRYTTLGIGTEQGATSSVLGAAILAELKGEPLGKVGTFRTRAPYRPVALKSLAGLRIGSAYRIARRTALDDWHAANGAVLESSGLWMRPRFYRSNGADAFTAGIAEASRVRASGGIADGSTLGKIEIAGPDAAGFLDSMYLTKAGTIKVGRSKYMVNLREDGMVLDDGLVLRLAADRFLATTSSGHAPHMLSHFEHYRDTEWGGRAVTLTDVTEAWGVIAVAGPQSRAALERVLGPNWHGSLKSLGHMDFADGRFQDRDLRVLRASFSGELAYELHCRPGIAVTLWQALIAAGLAPYGLEALDILRVEKGYLVSSEINGETTPHDLNMDGLLKPGNPCLGRELIDRPAFHEPSRPRLVGVRARDGKAKFLAGAQLTTEDESKRTAGYVTSAVYSPSLGEWVGLALLARRLGEEARIVARDPLRGGDTPLRVVSPVHFDPAGERVKS
jgi:heterotetrameric sarcosine oxidase alpha subunit